MTKREGDIAECAYCATDFVLESSRQKYCKTKACMRDRWHERNDRYAKKLKKEPGYAAPYGKDPTRITPNRWVNSGGRRKKEE